MFLTQIEKITANVRRPFRVCSAVLFLSSMVFTVPVGRTFAQTCSPASAQICVAGDDTSTGYGGGVSLGIVNYCNWDGTGACPPGCLSVPVSLLTGANVCLAIETQNTAPLINYSS